MPRRDRCCSRMTDWRAHVRRAWPLAALGLLGFLVRTAFLFDKVFVNGVLAYEAGSTSVKRAGRLVGGKEGNLL